MNHSIRKKIYEELKKEIYYMGNNISSNLKKLPKRNIYSKHNLYKYRKRNIYR